MDAFKDVDNRLGYEHECRTFFACRGPLSNAIISSFSSIVAKSNGVAPLAVLTTAALAPASRSILEQ